MHRWLPLLAAVSGMCGIAYEVMYARFVTTWVGDMFHVSAAVLAAFLLGIAAGALVASRYARHLWLVEGLIGAWAIAFALGFEPLFEAAAARGLVGFVSAPLGVVAFVFVMLLPPAVLIGFSVPLFALWIEAGGRSRDDAFASVYRLYNVGAAVAVLALEVVLLRALGQRGGLLALGATNLVIGALLFLAPRPEPSARQPLLVPVDEWRAPLLVLFGASVLSGVYQMFFLKLATQLFGPYRENFAFVVALGLLGLSVGTVLVRRARLSLEALLVLGAALVTLSLLATGPLVYLWAFLAPLGEASIHLFRALKLLVLALLGGGAFAVFGGTVPALLARLPDDRRVSGLLLAVSGAGNCLGYLAAVLVVYAWLEPERIAALVAGALALLAAPLVTGARTRAVVVTAGLIAAVAVGAAWPSSLLSLGYLSYRSLSTLAADLHDMTAVTSVRRFDSNVRLVRTSSGAETLIIDGYHSLVVNQQQKTNPRELLYGVVPALYPKARGRALVLGAGTGITAGAAASVFDDVTVIDVNPAIVELLPRFAEHNLGLASRDDARVVLADGITALWRGEERYDAIINTVTTPLFFSSSKLYTLDFFELVKRRLKPDGVYAMWFDARATVEGAHVIFQTVREAFADCHMVVMAAGYAQLVCGTQPLRPRMIGESDVDEALLALLRANDPSFSLPRLLEAMVLPAHTMMSRDWQAPVNTFDHPALELLMGDHPTMEGFRPFDVADADLRASAFRAEPLVGAALLERCAVLLRVTSLLPACAREATEDLGPGAQAAFSRMVRDQRLPLLPHLAAQLARVSLLAGDLDVAAELLEQAMDGRERTQAWLQVKAEQQLASTGDVDDELLAKLLVRSPMDPQLRRLFALALQQRGQGPLGRTQLEALMPGESRFMPPPAPTPFDTRATLGGP